MLKINHRTRAFLVASLGGLALAACAKTPSFQGSPPLSAVPNKVSSFAAPYVNAIVTPGVVGTAMLVGPNFLPGRCDEMYLTGDRKLICDQMARYNETPLPGKLPDPNAQYRCIRTLGGVTECNDAPRAARTVAP
jgi:hypothetical protein